MFSGVKLINMHAYFIYDNVQIMITKVRHQCKQVIITKRHLTRNIVFKSIWYF